MGMARIENGLSLQEVGLRRLLEGIESGEAVALSIRIALVAQGLVEANEAGGLSRLGEQTLDELRAFHPVSRT